MNTAIKSITKATGISKSMLASLLGVSEATLDRDLLPKRVLDRLLTFDYVVNEFILNGVRGKTIIALLEEPIDEDNEDRTILYEIQETAYRSWLDADKDIKKVCDAYKAEQLSIQEESEEIACEFCDDTGYQGIFVCRECGYWSK